jgi:hypothetical protein
MFYLVVSSHHEGPIVWEIQLHRMDRGTVTEDLINKQYDEVLAVIEFNPVERLCRDCTDEFREIVDRPADDL